VCDFAVIRPHKMQPIVTDAVQRGLSVCRSVTIASPAKMADEMVFAMWTWVGPRNRILRGVQVPAREGTILRGKSG